MDFQRGGQRLKATGFSSKTGAMLMVLLVCLASPCDDAHEMDYNGGTSGGESDD